MGGFAFDTSRFPSDGPLDGHREWITLSPKGLTFLAKNEPDLISNISKQQIEDKSKASDLVKAFAGVQILWFCAQVTTRLASALPITLLELNTFAHCLCALLIYFLWWNKPFDVEAPTLIPIPDHKSKTICAAMYMRSSIGMRKPLREPYIEGRKGRRLTEAVLEFEDECDEVSGYVSRDLVRNTSCGSLNSNESREATSGDPSRAKFRTLIGNSRVSLHGCRTNTWSRRLKTCHTSFLRMALTRF